MAKPLNPIELSRPMDPRDTALYALDISQGAEDDDFLRAGQGIASYTLALTAEAVAAGLSIVTTGPYATTLVGLELQFYLKTDSAVWADVAFDTPGVQLGIELTITTNDPAPEIKQRTVIVQVVQR